VVKLDYNLTANMKIDYPFDAVRVEQTSTPHKIGEPILSERPKCHTILL
jgi:hypothetical protein